MRASALLGWAIFAAVVYLVYSMRVEVDPQQEALQRTVDMVRAEYPGAQLLHQAAVPVHRGTGNAAAVVFFSEAGAGQQRSVYVDYSVYCEDPKPSCLVRGKTVWDYDDPQFIAEATSNGRQQVATSY